MMFQDNSQRDFQYLSTAIVTIAGYYALRACLILPKFIDMFADLAESDQVSGAGKWLFQYYQWPLPIMSSVLLLTLLSIWIRYRGSSLIVALGILFLAIGAHLITSAAMAPLFQMIQSVDEPY